MHHALDIIHKTSLYDIFICVCRLDLIRVTQHFTSRNEQKLLTFRQTIYGDHHVRVLLGPRLCVLLLESTNDVHLRNRGI